ncbi:MAG: M20/M25/M40 family metallo-hydrolase [Proteobacteria bacterium]|nr:M20/M25/M40 family metallo-hydrolase [Pseudomonadota bacterium]
MIDPQRLKRLLQRLIDIYSPSGKEEDILSYLKGFLKRKGIDVHMQDVDENRHNLIVAPRGVDIQLALIGHVDTVTAYDLDHYMFSENGDEISGLGAADMKGGCSAMIEAFLSLYEDTNNQNLPFALCLVVGEEETGDGAAQLMKEYRFPWALIGEPTDLVPCFQSYGYIESQINTVGKRQHASLAGRRKNPVESLLGGLLRFTNHLELKRPELIYNIRDLFTPPAGFSVPEYCEAWIDIHLPSEAPIGEIITEIEEVVSSRQTDPTEIDVRFRTETIDAGYDLPEKGPMKEILKRIFAKHKIPWKTNSFRSHSDANQIFSSGTKPILLGPGQLEKAHAQDESVPFQQVVKAAEIYCDFMKKILQ